MIARVKFDYSVNQKFKELATDPKILALLRETLGSMVPDDEALEREHCYWGTETLIDLETDGRVLTDLGIEFTIAAFKGTVAQVVPDSTGRPVDVHVHIPNVGLLMMDEVQVLNDYCTDALQDALNDGWRILCVCPPNAQRRPDYIMGRQKGSSE